MCYNFITVYSLFYVILFAMNNNTIYGDAYPEMERVLKNTVAFINGLRQGLTPIFNDDPVEHLSYRIKSDSSMREKCRRKGLPETEESALSVLSDAIGIRIVCAFRSDVYLIRDLIVQNEDFTIVEEKDYIKNAKPNGYRSYHMIIKNEGFFIELQLRTISMDTWAALEHQIKYKKKVGKSLSLITSELKRCADELASTDISMQTIRDMIRKMEDEN